MAESEARTDGLTPQEMMRQLQSYALAEMRNRGLEEAAKVLDRQRYTSGHDEIARLARIIRALKTDPTEHLTDWWGKHPPQKR